MQIADLDSAAAFFAAVHDEDREELQGTLNAALESGEPYDCEFRLHLPNGEVRWYRTSGKAIGYELGRPEMVVGVNFDITDRKRSEAALLQTEKLAAVGRLAAVVAHEINNPLEAVTNLLYLSRLSPAGPEQEQWLFQADRELRRVSAMASQTLRFHRQSTNPQPITCLSLFSATLDLYESRLTNNKITVEKRKRANEPILCFESDLRQVLSNIVSNSIDAMPHGGRMLVRSREGTDWRTGDKGLVLTIADTGAGISAKTQRRIFEPFYTTKGINGSGLGLWISQQIMARHEGRIRLRSSSRLDGHGTVISLFLPFGRVPVPATVGSLE